jgi:hypothetical protein
MASNVISLGGGGGFPRRRGGGDSDAEKIALTLAIMQFLSQQHQASESRRLSEERLELARGEAATAKKATEEGIETSEAVRFAKARENVAGQINAATTKQMQRGQVHVARETARIAKLAEKGATGATTSAVVNDLLRLGSLPQKQAHAKIDALSNRMMALSRSFDNKYSSAGAIDRVGRQLAQMVAGGHAYAPELSDVLTQMQPAILSSSKAISPANLQQTGDLFLADLSEAGQSFQTEAQRLLNEAEGGDFSAAQSFTTQFSSAPKFGPLDVPFEPFSVTKVDEPPVKIPGVTERGTESLRELAGGVQGAVLGGEVRTLPGGRRKFVPEGNNPIDTLARTLATTIPGLMNPSKALDATFSALFGGKPQMQQGESAPPTPENTSPHMRQEQPDFFRHTTMPDGRTFVSQKGDFNFIDTALNPQGVGVPLRFNEAPLPMTHPRPPYGGGGADFGGPPSPDELNNLMSTGPPAAAAAAPFAAGGSPRMSIETVLQAIKQADPRLVPRGGGADFDTVTAPPDFRVPMGVRAPSPLPGAMGPPAIDPSNLEWQVELMKHFGG